MLLYFIVAVVAVVVLAVGAALGLFLFGLAAIVVELLEKAAGVVLRFLGI